MKNKEVVCIEEIKKVVDDNQFELDVFLTGSASRKEERNCANKVISDIDLVIVVRNLKELVPIKNTLETVKKKYKDEVNISLIYCMFERFVKSELTDYVLSIDFQNPIIKKIDFAYRDLKNEKLNENRWIYQMQSAVFYYCKYMVSRKDIFICKAFQCLLRTDIYKKRLVTKNAYILVDEIERYVSEDSKKMLLQSRDYLMSMHSMDKDITKQIVNYVVDGITVAYELDESNKMGSILGSLKCFGEQMKESEGLLFESADYYNPMREVMNENLGIDDLSIISYD